MIAPILPPACAEAARDVAQLEIRLRYVDMRLSGWTLAQAANDGCIDNPYRSEEPPADCEATVRPPSLSPGWRVKISKWIRSCIAFFLRRRSVTA